MTPISRDSAPDGTQERYRRASGGVPGYHRRPSQPVAAPSAIYHDHAAANLRRHVFRAARRVLALAALDLTSYAALGTALDSLRAMPGDVGHFVSRQVPQGFLGGYQFAAALLMSLALLGNYGKGDARRSLRRIFMASSLATALPLWSQLWGAPLVVLIQFLAVVLATTAALYTIRRICDSLLWRVGPAPRAHVVVVGPGADCLEMISREDFAEREAMRFVGMVDTSVGTSATVMHTLSTKLAEHRADTVMLCGMVDAEVFSGVVRTAATAEAHVLATARSYEQCGITPKVVWRNGYPFIELRPMSLRGQQLWLKRCLDIVVASAALVTLAPVIAAIALAVRLDSPGPAVFGQRRLGRHGRGFRCFKFRSMYTDSEQRLASDPELHRLYVQNDFKLPPEVDTRITPVGRFLRRTSLDEIPQLWNVVRGDMSLVGPRPIVPAEIEHYRDQGPMLLLLKPGITGSWQVSGRSSCNYPERTNVELEYVQNWSLTGDLAILFRTVPAVLLQRGAH